MKLYILLVSKSSGPAFAYDDHPLIFTSSLIANKKSAQLNKNIDSAVYSYVEDVNCKRGDKLYVLSVGWYGEDETEYTCKEVKFFKTDAERKAYTSTLDGDDYTLYEFEYTVK